MRSKPLKEAIIDAWDALIPLVILNFIWFVLTILIVSAIPAFGGLYYAVNQISHGKTAGINTFFEGFKKYFWTSWKWGLFSMVIGGLLTLNVWFYSQFEGIGFILLRNLFIGIVLLFSCLIQYTYPFLLEQEKPSLKTALKNSIVAFIRYFGRTVLLLLSSITFSIQYWRLFRRLRPIIVSAYMGKILPSTLWSSVMGLRRTRSIFMCLNIRERRATKWRLTGAREALEVSRGTGGSGHKVKESVLLIKSR